MFAVSKGDLSRPNPSGVLQRALTTILLGALATLAALATGATAGAQDAANSLQSIDPPNAWDIPAGTPAIGAYRPGSWGGHSMWARDYDETGLWLVHTWGQKDQLITWRAAAVYLDEAHLVIDSLDYWRKHKPRAARAIDLAGVKKAVNAVSSKKIE